MPTDDFDLLGLIAEVSVAFIGFSMVVGVLRPDETHGTARIQSMRAVAETALIAGGGALLALTSNALDLALEMVWRIASLIVLAADMLVPHLGTSHLCEKVRLCQLQDRWRRTARLTATRP
jgi:hypothetical protein